MRGSLLAVDILASRPPRTIGCDRKRNTLQLRRWPQPQHEWHLQIISYFLLGVGHTEEAKDRNSQEWERPSIPSCK